MFKTQQFCASCIAVITTALVPHFAFAAWPHSPFTNLPVCTAAITQQYSTIATDGSGGAIVTWQDFRGLWTSDIYAQHVLASGEADPAWPANGLAICTAVSSQEFPVIVSDGAGGAVVTWGDARNGNYDIFAQHVLAGGTVDPAWPADGRALCTAAGHQVSPAVVSDGAGGAIVTWQDLRGGIVYSIYAQHVLAGGAVDPAWPADGRAFYTQESQQISPAIISDGAGGAIVTWQDARSGAYDIYAQRLRASGAVDPAWPAAGRALCAATDDQSSPRIVSDGAGGAIVTWHDLRSGTGYDIYSQHVLPSGGLDPAWPVNGRAVCTTGNHQSAPAIASDGAGGAIVAWHDMRSGTNYDIYAQHVQASGGLDPAWPAEGRALLIAPNDQWYPSVVSDGAGGAIVIWGDNRNGNYDIYAQHVQAGGVVDPAWPADGRALSTAAGTQGWFTVVTDGSGGANVTWSDDRNGEWDIYAQRVARFGYLGTPEAEVISVRDVAGDQGGKVKLSWNASYLDTGGDPNLSAYDVLRSVPQGAVAAARTRGQRVVPLGVGALVPGEILVSTLGAQTLYWEYLATVNALHYVSGYSYVAATTTDSTGTSNPLTAYMIVARNATTTMYWPSAPAYGYSVDDLAPVAPATFVGRYAAGSTTLEWSPNAESDLAGYRLYRGYEPAFAPGPGNLVAALAGTNYVDAAGGTAYYRLAAVDIHGNQSPYAFLQPDGTVGVDGVAPVREVSFARPAPNPAREGVSLAFALPREARVELAVFDPAGRRVRTLVAGVRAAGEHAPRWDLSDDAGRAVGAGLYFARLEVEGRRLVRRLAVTR